MDFGHDLDEDWLLSTIDRYQHLLIYDLLSTPYKIRPVGLDSAVIATRSKRGKHELLHVSLPGKLLKLDAAEAARCKNRDFAILGGTHLDGELIDLAVSSHSPGRLQFLTATSESGLSVYTFEEYGVVSHEAVYLKDSLISSLDLAGSLIALASSDTSKLFNLEIACVTKEFRHRDDISRVKFMSENELLTCEKENGTINLLDLRTGQIECILPSCDKSYYTFDNSENLTVRASRSGKIDVFDLRYPKSLRSFKEEDSEPAIHCLKDKFLVAGVGGNVAVYTSEKKIFEHEGHLRNSESECVRTLDASWYGYRGDIAFSCADDGSVHIWEPVFDVGLS